MHVRLSTCLGAAVSDRATGEVIGALGGLFIHPDTGKAEGIYVRVPAGIMGNHVLFCSASDIAHWGTGIHIRDRDALSSVEDRVRLAPLLDEGRTVLNQRIQTQGGHTLGVCKDVQLDTESMRVEWLFPRRWFRWGIALPMGEVVEVRREAVIVRDGPKPDAVSDAATEPPVYEAFPEIAEACIMK